MTRLTIKRLGFQGDGIADWLNGDVFVPFALPGEVVEGTVENGRMATPKIVTPSDQRVKPPCAHFKSCGGCALQHASDDYLADWKVQVVKTALAAHGLTPDISGPFVSPARSRRRATLTGRRTKKAAIVGFHGRASDVVMPIPSCTLLHPDILAAIPGLEALTRIGASRKGALSLAVTCSASGLDVAVTNGKDVDGPTLANLGATVDRFGFARLSWNGDAIATRSRPTQRFGSATVTPPPGAFLQATEAGQAALVGAVHLAVNGASHLADLFAGCGTFTLPLAEFGDVLAVESEADALAALDTAWRGAFGLKAVQTMVRDLFRRPLLPDELNKFDAVVIDPPRAGAMAQCKEIAASKLTCVASVSCNPVTFARDAKMLTDAGFQIEWVQVIDQFRWSPHVELVARLTRDV